MELVSHFVLLLVLVISAVAQQRGSVSPEIHPALTTYKCTKSGGCVAQTNKIVLDANWRWLHGPQNSGGSYPPCITSSNTWDPTLCPDPTTCAQNCYLEGVNYTQYGITTNGASLTMLMYPQSGSTGSRLYLLAPNTDQNYQLLNLKNQEISFDVDVSGLPCGMASTLYLTSMAADGGQSAYANNKAGAYMGTGYCDAQCPQDPKFINGQANSINWSNSRGRYGSCCHEMDLWEANAISTQFAAHPCSVLGQYRCDSSGTDCGECTHDGCEYSSYRLGNTNFYGPGGSVSTAPGKMRVITQFITSDGTATGTLTEVRRAYIRGGVTYTNPNSQVSGIVGNSLTDNFCSQETNVFGGSGSYTAKGGMRSMDSAFSNGMVLALSIWVDYGSHMLWLDSTYPPGSTATGAARGTCPTNSGDPGTMQGQYPNAQVQFSNIKYGDIGSTFGPPTP